MDSLRKLVQYLRANRTIRLLIAGNAALMVVAVGIIITLSRTDVPRSLTGGLELQRPALDDTRMRPNLDAARERPIFHTSRHRREAVRPAAVASAAAPTVQPSQLYQVTGVLNSGNDRIAYISVAKSGETIRARVGDILGEWKLTEIRADGAVVAKGDETSILRLAP